ncbi:unnamed protein product [Ambrosiozyma monospora]|uniref:Unnamed protein product n=1 Tax=Ambrosiozyma monospora TaxID=43982 RepID=A0ACB5TD29_AMBMO|nr:unnamed protein product [Ambrosiozyma monospora]
MQDRSNLVRKSALALLSELVTEHPYNAIGDGTLRMTVWKQRLQVIKDEITELEPNFFSDDVDETANPMNETMAEEEQNVEGESEGDGDADKSTNEGKQSQSEQAAATTTEPQASQANTGRQPGDSSALAEAQLKLSYVSDCIKFIKMVEQASEVCCELLYSKSKPEVIGIIEFFELLDSYGIENATNGIKKMLHLVWMDGDEEAKKVVRVLMLNYTKLYLTYKEDSRDARETARYIARNLIKLTYNTSMADLASLEKLLGLLYLGIPPDPSENKGRKTPQAPIKPIDGIVIDTLWQIFNFDGAPPKNRRGAIIVLGMLALVENRIAVKGLNSILSVGLDLERKDWVVVAFSCIAINRLVPAKDPQLFDIPRAVEIIEKLKRVCLEYTDDGEWFHAAEEALNTIFTISTYPDQVCTEILKKKAVEVFSQDNNDDNIDKSVSLSQLLFLVGHVGLKTIVHLEKLEADFKKKKIVQDGKKSEADQELEMIGGNNEDDFSDIVTAIREKELLYTEGGLLAKFVPLIQEVVSKPSQYNDVRLQRQAVLCLAKFMCISPRFCEDNMPLYLTIMERSKDAIVRSNCVLALGDMAVCFNHVIDNHRDALYGKLQDENRTVQRTCLMTVTFLILAGQVKVKGQLAQMAKLYVNNDRGIVDMCKTFFNELATKDNAVYNGFMDMFSGLSADKKLAMKDYKSIINFVALGISWCL